jgi:hypothetical protein
MSADTAVRSKGHFAVLQGMLQDATNFTHLQSFVSCRLIKTSSKLSVHETKDQIGWLIPHQPSARLATVHERRIRETSGFEPANLAFLFHHLLWRRIWASSYLESASTLVATVTSVWGTVLTLGNCNALLP